MNQFKLRATVAAVAGVALFGLAAGAKADSTDDLLKKLRDKGVLSEQEYDEFNATRDTEKVKKQSEIKASFKDGISWESGDKQHAMALTGRVHFDYRDVGDLENLNEDNRDLDTATIGDQFEIRRARLGVKGRFYNSYEYEIVTNLVGSNANLVDTAWLNINWWDAAQFRFGRFKQPFSLEEQTSSNNIDFMERSYVNALTPGKRLGAMLHGEPVKGLNYGLSVYQDGFNELSSDTSDEKGVGGRVAANLASFAGWSDTVLHVGLAMADENYGLTPTQSNNTSSTLDGKHRASVIAFRNEARGLNNVYRAQLGGTTASTAGAGLNVDFGASDRTTGEVEKKLKGVELAATYGPFKLQGEYAKAEYDANHIAGNSTVKGDVKAWYAEALWLITGEKYSDFYKGGAFGSIKPKNDFVHPSAAASSGGWGAWELGLRMSRFDATDMETTGANSREQGSDETKTYTAGIKWIVNPNVRFLMNYSKTDYDTAFTPIDVAGGELQDSERELSVRGQIAF